MLACYNKEYAKNPMKSCGFHRIFCKMENDALMDTICDGGTVAAGGVCNRTLDFVTEGLRL